MSPRSEAVVFGGGAELSDVVVSLPGEAVLADESQDAPLVAKGGEDDFRMRFLRKLTLGSIWATPRQPRHQTVIIFDWDDTLLCTTWLRRFQDRPLTLAAEQQLRAAAKLARDLVEAATGLGQTYIVTNALLNWVGNSAARWVPELVPALQQVRVLSARERYEEEYPVDVRQWKIQMFLELQRGLDQDVLTNLVVLGDSHYEMDAARIMSKGFDQVLTKTVKFRETPSLSEHVKQLRLAVRRFEGIVASASDVRVVLDVKPGKAPGTPSCAGKALNCLL